MNHDKAIEAAARTDAGDIWDHYHEMMITESRAEFIEERWKLSVPSVKKIISAFLREVYAAGYRDGQERMRDLMRGTLTEEFAASQFPIKEPPT